MLNSTDEMKPGQAIEHSTELTKKWTAFTTEIKRTAKAATLLVKC